MASLRMSVFIMLPLGQAWTTRLSQQQQRHSRFSRNVLSDAYLENDLVAVKQKDTDQPARLCAVRYDGSVAPLCIREDDVETDLFVDPREFASTFWTTDVTDECVQGEPYGEGFYGQRPVPSLGGGPGYGAEADPVWSVDEEVLEKVRQDGVTLPTIDMGISHGEKARAGAF